MLSKRLKFTLAVIGATSVALAGIGLMAGEGASPIQAASMPSVQMPRMSLAKRLSKEFEALHRAIKNSVVCINVVQEVPQNSVDLPMQLPRWGSMVGVLWGRSWARRPVIHWRPSARPREKVYC